MSKTEKKKLGLIPKLLIAIGLGTLAGLYMPQWFVKTAVTFSSMFGAFLNFDSSYDYRFCNERNC